MKYPKNTWKKGNKSDWIIVLALILVYILPAALVNASGLSVAFTEIMYNPAGTDEGFEWIEIRNNGADEVDLSSWRLVEGGSSHTLNAVESQPYPNGDGILASGEYAVIADDASQFLSDYPDFDGTIFDSAWGSLHNSGEEISLKTGLNGDIVSTLTYHESWGADGNGRTLEKIGLFGGDGKDNWGEGVVDGGTPGSVNSISGGAESTTSSTTSLSSTTSSTTTTSSSTTTTSVLSTTSSTTSSSSSSTSTTTLSSSSSSTTTTPLSSTSSSTTTITPLSSSSSTTTLSSLTSTTSTSSTTSSTTSTTTVFITSSTSTSSTTSTLTPKTSTTTTITVTSTSLFTSSTSSSSTSSTSTTLPYTSTSMPADPMLTTTITPETTTYPQSDRPATTLPYSTSSTSSTSTSTSSTTSSTTLTIIGLDAGRVVRRCSDKTRYSACSTTQPLYCLAGELVERCSLCGCPGELDCVNGSCVKSGDESTSTSSTISFHKAYEPSAPLSEEGEGPAVVESTSSTLAQASSITLEKTSAEQSGVPYAITGAAVSAQGNPAEKPAAVVVVTMTLIALTIFSKRNKREVDEK